MSKSATLVKKTIALESEDAVLIAFLRARYAKDGRAVTEADIMRMLLKPKLNELRERLAPELLQQKVEEESEEEEGGE